MDADTKYEAIEAAFRALVQEANGRPLANLFRELLPKAGGGIVPVPLEVVAEIAELLDPRFPSSRFSKPPPDLPPDQVQIVNGEPRLKAMVKLDEAVKAANIERVRLAHIHNEEANKIPRQARKMGSDARSVRRRAGRHESPRGLRQRKGSTGQVRGSAGRPPRGPRST
jgi:hypothetical protein